MENYVKVFSGSEVEVIRIRLILDQNDIKFMERNDIQSGVAAGFGTIDKAVHILVDKADYHRALKAIDNMRYDELAD